MRQLTKDEQKKINDGREEAVGNFRKHMIMELLAEAKEKMFDASIILNKCESLMEFGYHDDWFRDVELMFGRIWTTAIEEFQSEIDELKDTSHDDDIGSLVARLKKIAENAGFNISQSINVD